MVTVSGNPNPTYPTNPTNPTNPTTKYRCEFGTLFCIYANLNSNPTLTLTLTLRMVTNVRKWTRAVCHRLNTNTDSNPHLDPNPNPTLILILQNRAGATYRT